ncbi:MAG: VWA domain-containing protein, partial [Candidatus Limnocylindrales bacterium]
MNANRNTTKRLQLKQDRQLIRSRWHSSRFVVARVAAPEVETTTERQPVNLAFVIDRSGSMHGKPIELAMKAVEEAIRRLKSGDRFSVVVFDNEVDTVVPGVFASPEARSRAIEEIRRVGARGSTNLSGGWLQGCKL